MRVTCVHCQHGFEHEVPAHGRGGSQVVCPSCGRDTPVASTFTFASSIDGGPAVESRVYCFNCGKSMSPREGELIPVCDACRQDRAVESEDSADAPVPDEPVADWMIRKANANVYGPFPSETIVGWIKARKILPDEEVAHIGGAWRLFSQHEEFGRHFEKAASSTTVPKARDVDFRQKNTGRAVVRALTRGVLAAGLMGGLGFGLWYAIENDSLVVSESAMEDVVDRVSDVVGSGQGRKANPQSVDAGKLLMALAEAHPGVTGGSMERTYRGRTLMLRDNLPNLQKARAELEAAIVLDPHNALALAGLAELYNILAYQGYGNLDLQRQSIYLLDLAEAEGTFEAEVLRARAGFLIYSGNVAEGEVAVQEALSRNPGDPELHFLLGIASLGGRDRVQTETSREHLEKALELDPDYHQVWYELARGEESAGRLREAIAHYTKKLELDPGSALSHHRLGRIFEAVGERKKAAGHYDKAIAINPKYKESVLRRAILASHEEGDYSRSARLLQGLWDGTTVEVDLRIGERKEVGGYLAAALRLSGDPEGAVAVADQLLADDRNYGPGNFHKGMALFEQGKGDEALPYLNRTDEADISRRERAIAKYQVGIATSNAGRPFDAQEAFEAAIEFDPGYIPAYIWLAESMRGAGAALPGAQGLMKHIAQDPLDYGRKRTLSAIHQPAGDLVSIGVAMLEAAEKEGFSPEIYAAAGVAFFHGGDAKSAAEAFGKALEESEEHVPSLFYLGLMDFQAGRMAPALERFEAVLGVGNEPIFHVYRGEALANRGRNADAIASYERGLGSGLRSSWAHSGLATALAKAGEAERARSHLETAFDLDETAVAPRRSRFQADL